MAYNIARTYGKNKVNTASPAELTLMLYDGAVKFCNKAVIALEKKDYEGVNYNIQRTRNIVVELKTTLNHKYPVADDFEKLYDYIFMLLVDANMKKDMELLERALEELRSIRDIWKQIMAQTKGPQVVLDT
ncbi:MAG: flagellar export chaperone FliS [Lachnospiraceae bacterium]|nr:flagellar export chaperone FliS [Lachnospiraceae bacterium]